jgi:hypothetical protein
MVAKPANNKHDIQAPFSISKMEMYDLVAEISKSSPRTS